jgi:hypothetical protein
VRADQPVARVRDACPVVTDSTVAHLTRSWRCQQVALPDLCRQHPGRLGSLAGVALDDAVACRSEPRVGAGQGPADMWRRLPLWGASPPSSRPHPAARRHEGAWDGCCRAFSKGFLPCALTSPRTVERSAVRIALPRSVGTATPTYASSSAIANKLKLQRRCHRRDDEIGIQNQNQIYVPG